MLIYDGELNRLANYHLNGYVTGIAMNAEGDRLGVVSVESQNGLWVTKITVIRIEKRITQESVLVSGSFGSTCGFLAEDRFAVMLSDRLMVLKSDATVVGEELFGENAPTLSAMGKGTVAVLTKTETELSETVLKVYDKNGRLSYETTLQADHPVQRAGGATAMTLGDDVLFMRAGNTLFRLSNEGTVTMSAAISHDTLAILPYSGDEVTVCTPAYAYRLEKKDFIKE